MSPKKVQKRPGRKPGVVKRADLDDRLKKLDEQWGSAIFDARVDQEITQAELAEMIGITPQHLSRIEWGCHHVMDKTKLQIAEALGVNPDEMFSLA